MKFLDPPLLASEEEYDAHIALVEEMKGWDEVDEEEAEEQIEHLRRRRLLAVRIVPRDVGDVRLRIRE